MTDKVLMLYNDAMLAHDGGAEHPERPDRLLAITGELDRHQIEGVRLAKPQAATHGQIERIHDAKYVNWIDSLRDRSARLDSDTAVSPGSVNAAYQAAGAAMDATTAVMDGTAQRAFALVRPPGHHAERDRAMGFCLFNNIAVAAEHAIAELGCRRVLIVDWDVHHGNGTQHVFEARRDVLVFNTHQWPLYPGTGALHEVGRGEGEGFTVNCPLPSGMGDAEYHEVFRRLLAPIAAEYKPELVLVSAGFDAHRDDPLGGMKLTEDGFAALCAMVRGIADEHADGRLALILEGGYNLSALARSVYACVEIMTGRETPAFGQQPSRQACAMIEELCAIHQRYWPV